MAESQSKTFWGTEGDGWDGAEGEGGGTQGIYSKCLIYLLRVGFM